MTLQSQFLCSFASHAQQSVPFLTSTQPSLTIRSQKKASSDETSNLEDSPNKFSSKKAGVGFGPSNLNSNASSNKRKEKGQRERASIIRRSPVEKPAFVSEQQLQKGQTKEEQGKNESAFILAWLGFGAVILVEGIALAASGFLPEEWDRLFVKYLYPSFTPTVFLFVAGAVAFGVFKYKQNEKITEQK